MVDCLRQLLDEAGDELVRELEGRCGTRVDKMRRCLAAGVLEAGGREHGQLAFAEVIEQSLRACGERGKRRLELALDQELSRAEGPNGPAAQLLSLVSDQLNRPLHIVRSKDEETHRQLFERKNCFINSIKVRRGACACRG